MVPSDAYYGIHSLRAKLNFPDQTRFHKEWYQSLGTVKLACYITAKSFRKAVLEKHSEKQLAFSLLPEEVLDALVEAATKVSDGQYFDEFIVPAISGGAGTSINMNINEIIANVALESLGKSKGEYSFIDPIESANIYQSTNDVIPTSLKVAIIKLLTELEEEINFLRQEIEKCESASRNELRIAYTQMQEAVPSSLGMLFSTYSEALSRDWWRVSKCFERIKVVNLGGSAIGTGIGVPRFFIMEVLPALQRLTNQPITRSENLSDATNNLDSFVEVHAIMKSHAVNLEKMVSDLRLLASDVAGSRTISIPQQQVGSSIMPGKVNPVIPEYVVSVAHKVYSNDMLVSSLCAQGCLDLNAYLPVIGHAILESLKLLISSNRTLHMNMISGIRINQGAGNEQLFRSPAITTALSPFVGYNKAALIAKEMKSSGIDVFEANRKLKIMDETKLVNALKPENLLKTGFSLNDILD
ncbi:MAG: aspartate ammonia-lyase [Bacteroidetes bacterium]|nr:aspartate ammonia-lyase [Bacteroidota bacterium]